jgi:hypothetical protein
VLNPRMSVGALPAAIGEGVVWRLLRITKYSDIPMDSCYALGHGQSSRGSATTFSTASKSPLPSSWLRAPVRGGFT